MKDTLSEKALRQIQDDPATYAAFQTGVMQNFGVGVPEKDPMDESRDAFTRSQRDRLKREYEKFYPREEDE